MDQDESRTLRTVTHAKAIVDLKAGRVAGPLRWAVVDTAMSTGLRVSELARLTCGDVDVRRGALRVTRSKKRHKPKPELMAISKPLLDHLQEFLAWKKLADQPTGSKDALFYGKQGRLTAQGLQRIWKAAVREAGLPAELSIHSARHTLAVHLLRSTGNLRMVQKALGHSSPTVTANMYADVTFEDMKEGLNGVYDDED